MSIMNGYQLNWFAPDRTEYKLSLMVVKSFPVWSLAMDMVWVFMYLNKLHNNESKSSTSCWRDPESRKTVLCLCSISRLFQPTSGFYRNVLSMWKWFTRQINTPHTQIHTHMLRMARSRQHSSLSSFLPVCGEKIIITRLVEFELK